MATTSVTHRVLHSVSPHATQTAKQDKAILKALNLTPEEKKEFLQVAKEKGTTIGQLVVDLLRGYVDANRIRQ